jgi:exonuclease SbcD
MTEVIRFVHAADVHLDAPFAGVDASDPHVRDALVRSTREAFDRVVDTCVERVADFLVLSGDVYNSRDKSLKAQFDFGAAMERLAQAGVDVFVARGNHDPEDGWSAGLDLPDNVRFFPSDRVGRFEVRRDGRVVCAVYGRGFGTASVTSDLSGDFRRGADDPVAVGVLHTNVGGHQDHEPYAPSKLETLRAAGMDYWALGHIHKAERLSDSPRIVYSGSTQGLNPKETGVHGCRLVEIAAGVVTDEPVPTCSVVWDAITVDVSEAVDMEAVRSAVHVACHEVRERAEGRPAVVRIAIGGRTEAHRDLVRGRVMADLVDAVRDEQMGLDPWVWVDRIRDLTAAPLDLETIAGGQDLAGDLVRLAADLAESGEAADLVAEVLAPLEERVGVQWSPQDARAVVERARDACLDAFGAEEA